MFSASPFKKVINQYLPALLTGKNSKVALTRTFFHLLFTRQISTAQSKAILLLMAHKGETANELWGAVSELRKLEPPIGPKIPGLIDTCGTGGDKSHSINISTLAAIVIAGAGGRVAKHGNRAISSDFGSSDLMEALGIKLDAPPAKMLCAIRKAGIGYFHAPFYHPVFAELQLLRRSLKRRTILNLLGPLVNPMRLEYQLVGVAEKRLLPLYAKVLAKLGRKSALVYHSADGMDEISSSKLTHIALIANRKIRFGRMQPRNLGIQGATRSDLRVSQPFQNLRFAKRLLAGREKGARRDAVLLTAACGLYLLGKADSLRAGIRIGQQTLESGKALQTLRTLKKIVGRR